ncbi:MAG: arsenite methyltransferase [Armatimonadia bacterium]
MDDVKRAVKENYAEVARKAKSGCGCGPVTQVAPESVGYQAADVSAAPEGSNMGLGCGNPLAIADLKPGETVLDLGSGGGFDCFLAANAVGPEGRAIGVDMTEEMIEAARGNAARVGYTNVEFRHGEIEALPVGDTTVDVVISNCVINLVPDKHRAFAEAYRVLKPGGRLHVSDIVLSGEAPPEVLASVAAYVNCVAGAVSETEYLGAMQAAGLTDITIHTRRDASELLNGCCGADSEPTSCCCCSEAPADVAGLAESITVSARKPL